MRLWWNTAAFVFTHCLGTSPGRYGHAMVEQGQTVVLSGRRLDVPLSRQSAAVHRGHRTLHRSPTLPQGRAPDHPGPERGTRRRRVGRAAGLSLFHKGRPYRPEGVPGVIRKPLAAVFVHKPCIDWAPGGPAKAELLWGEEERMKWNGYPPQGGWSVMEFVLTR